MAEGGFNPAPFNGPDQAHSWVIFVWVKETLIVEKGNHFFRANSNPVGAYLDCKCGGGKY